MRISELLVPLQNAVLGRKDRGNHRPRTGKHHGSEGRRRRKKDGEKLPNVTSETHRKMRMSELLVPLQARFLGKERPRKTTARGQGNTMAVKGGEGARKAAKNSLT